MFSKDFNKFLVDNKIVGSMVGVVIAIVLGDLIKSLIQGIIFPLLHLLLLKLKLTKVKKIVEGSHKFNFVNILNSFLSFLLTLFVTYYFVLYFFNDLLDVNID